MGDDMRLEKLTNKTQAVRDWVRFVGIVLKYDIDLRHLGHKPNTPRTCVAGTTFLGSAASRPLEMI